jgi:hypothetical protein
MTYVAYLYREDEESVIILWQGREISTVAMGT